MRHLKTILLGFAMLLSLSVMGQQQTITATFSVDNFFAVYKGNSNGVSQKLMPSGIANGIQNGASQLRNPAVQSFQLDASDWLYIIAWRDNSSYQGVLGSFTGDRNILTGDSVWQVLATNELSRTSNITLANAPDTSNINRYIRNAAPTDWHTPNFGPINTVSSTFTLWNMQVAGIPTNARWMWNYIGTPPSLNTPFAQSVVIRNPQNPNEVIGSKDGNYLIFRFPVTAVMNNPCPTPNIQIKNIKTGFNLGKNKTTAACLDPQQVSLTVDGLPASTPVSYTVSQNNTTLYSGNFTTSSTPSISNIVALRSNMSAGAYTVTLNWGNNCTAAKGFQICSSTTQDPCQNAVLWVKNSVLTTGSGDAAKSILSSGKCLPAENNLVVLTGLTPNTYATYIVLKSDGTQVMQNGNFTSNSDSNIQTTIPLNVLPAGNYTIQVFVKDQLCKSTTFEICNTTPKPCTETANVVFVRKQAGMPRPITADCVDANLDYEFLVNGFTATSPQIFYTLTKDGQILANNQPLQNSRVSLNNAQAGTYLLTLKWADCPPFTKEIKICAPTTPGSACTVDCCTVPSTLLDREMLFKSLSSIFFSNVNNRLATIKYQPTPAYISSIDAYKNYINSQLRAKNCAEGTLDLVFKLWKYKLAPNTVSNGEQLRDIFLNENSSKPSFELKSQITDYTLATEFNHQLETSNSYAYVVEVVYQWTGNNNLTSCGNSAVGAFVSGVQARRAGN